MKKIIIGFNVMLILVVSSLSIPDIKNYLHQVFPQFYIIFSFIGLFGNVFIFLFPYFFSLNKEKERILAFQRNKSIDVVSEAFIKKYGKYGFSINIMTLTKKYYQWLPPPVNSKRKRKKFKILLEVFETVWEKGDTFSRQLEIASDQGIYGEAFKDGHQTGMHGLFIEDEIESLRSIYNERQLKMLQKFLFTGSCAVSDKNDYRKSIALVNVETKNPKAVAWLIDPKNYRILTKDVKKLAEVYEGLI